LSQTIKTSGSQSSPESIRITRNKKNNSVTLTFIDDNSHGYREFTLSEKDFNNFMEASKEI
jgi:hypothetical protein